MTGRPRLYDREVDAAEIMEKGLAEFSVRKITELLGWTSKRVQNAIRLTRQTPDTKPEKPEKEKKKPIRISKLPIRNADLKPGIVHRILFTSAQDDTPVYLPFWENLIAYAQHLNAGIIVGGYTYQIGLFEDHAAATAVYAPEIRDYLSTDRVQITPDLLYVGDANILPTTANPLNGWLTTNGGGHVIVPHARVAFDSIPRLQSQPPRFATSTGTCTEPNYTPRAAGRKAVQHHTYGALLVEIDVDGEVFMRHLQSDATGDFQDLDVIVHAGQIYDGNRVEAITWGDIHHEQMDPVIAEASFGIDIRGRRVRDDNLLDRLQPCYQFLHDTLDFRRRNHHDIKDPHQRAKVLAGCNGNVEDEVLAAAIFANAVRRDWCQTILVESNHDAAIAKWLKEAEGAMDPENAYYWHRLNAIWHQAIRESFPDFNIVENALRGATLADDIAFVASGGSCVIAGVECGMHGDLGVSGSRGSPNQYRRFGPKTTSGHTHTPKIVEGVYVAGVSAKLDQGYNRGPTTWAHAHVVLYSNGVRALICLSADGRYQAVGDLKSDFAMAA